MLKRDLKPLYLSSLARSLLEVSQHAAIDLLLKNLKNVSRRLHTAFGAFEDEHRLLERLYYKGKNQHRLSLFWRRVVETRRFCRRLNEMRMEQDVDMLRSSFFGAGSPPSNLKAIKGSWTHYPNTASVTLVSQRLSAGSALLLKMQEKLLAGYRSLTLAMQSGAFLQLTLALVAVFSRIKAVCQALFENIQFILDIAKDLNNVLLGVTTSSASPSRPEPTDDTADCSVCSASLPREQATPQDMVTDAPIRTVVQRKVTETVTSADQPVKVERPRRERKKGRQKKPKDEIDDIFGF